MVFTDSLYDHGTSRCASRVHLKPMWIVSVQEALLMLGASLYILALS